MGVINYSLVFPQSTPAADHIDCAGAAMERLIDAAIDLRVALRDLSFWTREGDAEQIAAKQRAVAAADDAFDAAMRQATPYLARVWTLISQQPTALSAPGLWQ